MLIGKKNCYVLILIQLEINIGGVTGYYLGPSKEN